MHAARQSGLTLARMENSSGTMRPTTSVRAETMASRTRPITRSRRSARGVDSRERGGVAGEALLLPSDLAAHSGGRGAERALKGLVLLVVEQTHRVERGQLQ